MQQGVVITKGLLNRIEMACRAQDSCFACATHSLPGQMPLEVVIYNQWDIEFKRRFLK